MLRNLRSNVAEKRPIQTMTITSHDQENEGSSHTDSCQNRCILPQLLVDFALPPNWSPYSARDCTTSLMSPASIRMPPLSNYLKMARRHCRRNHRSAHASCNTPR